MVILRQGNDSNLQEKTPKKDAICLQNFGLVWCAEKGSVSLPLFEGIA